MRESLHLTPLLASLFILATAAAAGDDDWTPAERENYRHFQLNLIGHEPTPESFREGYAFIQPLHAAAPESEAYRICYAQAVSGFAASAEDAAKHIAAVEALAPIPPAQVAETEHLGILLMNLMERVTEDGTLLRDERKTPQVRAALRRADGVAAAIFAHSLARGVWTETRPGSADWSIRPGMPERRERLLSPPSAGGTPLPQWSALAPTQWLPEALAAARELAPVYRDPPAFTPRSAP
jgi:hypothetical protein